MSHVPIIDIGDPSSAEVDSLDAACRDHGFFLLTGHGLDDLIDRTFSAGARFFAADPVVKASVRRTKDNPLGWFDRELTRQMRDHKEVFDFIDSERHSDRSMNQWPDGEDDFRATMDEFFAAFATLATRTLNLVWETLGIDSGTVDDLQGSRWTSAVRLNHYTLGDPVPADQRSDLASLGDVALGQHTDAGVITLLLQDDTGGLQTESIEHGWIDVEPKPGTVVVNLGDAVQVWSNDRYRAARHRVLPMTTSTRMSIPFFMNPRPGAVLAPVTGIGGAGPRYRPFKWQEFMAARTADNFTDLGQPDTGIADYAISPQGEIRP